MRVYVLERIVIYEGMEIIDVFDSWEKANEQKNQLEKEEHPPHMFYGVYEFEVK